MSRESEGKKRNFLSMGRREAIQALGAALLGTAYAYLVNIPDFENDKPAKNENSKIFSDGNFVWDEKYNAEFIDRYVSFLRSIRDQFDVKFLDGVLNHPFPIEKYRLTKERTLDEGILMPSDFSTTEPVTLRDILSVHSKGQTLELYFNGYSRLGLLNGENPIMPELLDYVRAASGGTYTAARIALEKGVAMNLNGGFHHAMANKEYGFCYINDVAITIKKLRSEGAVKKVMIVDLDAHHGDGNAKIMENDPNVAIFDTYQENNFPEEKIPVEYAVPIDTSISGMITDSVYLNAIKGLPAAIEKENPDLIIYLAGADPHRDDMLGGFMLSKQGLMDRDDFVIKNARKRDIPIAVVTAGGYPMNSVDDVVDIHENTIKLVKNYS